MELKKILESNIPNKQGLYHIPEHLFWNVNTLALCMYIIESLICKESIFLKLN